MTNLRRAGLSASIVATVLVVVVAIADAPTSVSALVVFPYLVVIPGLPWALALRLPSRILTLVVALSLSLALATVLSNLSYMVRAGRGLPVLLVLGVCTLGGVIFERRTGPRFAAAARRARAKETGAKER